jgi:soluble lytic murein transglycosylase
MAVLGTADGLSAEHLKPASASSAERPKPASHRKTTAEAEHHKRKETEHHKGSEHPKEAEHSKEVEPHKHLIEQLTAGDVPPAPLSPDLAAVKQANELVRQGKAKEAAALAALIGDPVAAKLVEWALLRRSDSEAGFERYVAFMRANPDWPSMTLMRRRAEARLSPQIGRPPRRPGRASRRRAQAQAGR